MQAGSRRETPIASLARGENPSADQKVGHGQTGSRTPCARQSAATLASCTRGPAMRPISNVPRSAVQSIQASTWSSATARGVGGAEDAGMGSDRQELLQAWPEHGSRPSASWARPRAATSCHGESRRWA